VAAKSIFRGVLLAFVAASIGVLVVKGSRTGAPETPAPPAIQPVAAATEQPATPAVEAPSRTVIAYYFHGNRRCMSCRKIEAFSHKAITTGFREALDAGRLEWRMVNCDEPGNEHYLKDYNLYTKQVVLVEVENGEQRRWKDLDKVWDLLGSEAGFVGYIQDEVRAYLGEG